MKTPIQVLIVEDEQQDAALLADFLRREGLIIEYECVDTPELYQAALKNKTWHVIFSDVRMPAFSVLEALKILHDAGLDIPFIVVSGFIGEEKAVELLKAGATDYISKSNMSRLAPALKRDLHDAHERAQRRALEKSLNLSHMHLEAMLNNIPDAAWMKDEALRYISINDAALRIIGRERSEVIGKRDNEFWEGLHVQQILQVDREILRTGAQVRFEMEIIDSSSPEKPVRLMESIQSPVFDDNGKVISIASISRDITDRKKQLETLKKERDYTAWIIQDLPALVVCLDIQGNIKHVNPAVEKAIGYTEEELLTQSPWTCLYPGDDYRQVVELFEKVRADNLKNHEMTLTTKSGEKRTILWNSFKRLDTEGIVTEIVALGNDMTEMNNAEKAIRESERFARSTFDSLAAHIAIIDEQGSILAVNKAWREFGKTNRLIVPFNPEGLNYFSVLENDIDGNAKRAIEGIKSVLSGERPDFRMEYSCLLDGTEIWFAMFVNPFIGDGPTRLVISHEDITLRKTSENEVIKLNNDLQAMVGIIRNQLNHSQNRETLARSITDQIREELDIETVLQLTVERIGKLIQVERCILWNYSGEISGFSKPTEYRAHKAIPSVLDEDIFPLLPDTLWSDDILTFPDVQSLADLPAPEAEHIKKSGVKSMLHLPIRYKSQFLGVLRIHSITCRKEWDEETVDLLKTVANHLAIALRHGQIISALKEAKETAEQANHKKSEFLTSMSHELRTPLHTIILCSSACLEGLLGPLSEKQTEYLTNIYNSSEHLLTMIEDILDIAKIEAGKLELNLQPVIVDDLLENALSIVNPLFEGKDQRLTVKKEPTCPPVIHADPVRLKQVLCNLLSNAHKFTPEGKHIILSCQAIAQELVLSVEDEGIGINQADLYRMMQPFEQVKALTGGKIKGTGLGLPLAKKITEMHGGKLKAKSQPGQGSCFSVHLPLLQFIS